jgi:hypothetical protein
MPLVGPRALARRIARAQDFGEVAEARFVIDASAVYVPVGGFPVVAERTERERLTNYVLTRPAVGRRRMREQGESEGTPRGSARRSSDVRRVRRLTE